MQVDTAEGNIICRVQECPSVLRQTVCDMFPDRNLDASELSIVTLTVKDDQKLPRQNNEAETEKLAQTVSIFKTNPKLLVRARI